jgi:hypothetical protein
MAVAAALASDVVAREASAVVWESDALDADLAAGGGVRAAPDKAGPDAAIAACIAGAAFPTVSSPVTAPAAAFCRSE